VNYVIRGVEQVWKLSLEGYNVMTEVPAAQEIPVRGDRGTSKSPSGVGSPSGVSVSWLGIVVAVRSLMADVAEVISTGQRSASDSFLRRTATSPGHLGMSEWLLPYSTNTNPVAQISNLFFHHFQLRATHTMPLKAGSVTHSTSTAFGLTVSAPSIRQAPLVR